MKFNEKKKLIAEKPIGASEIRIRDGSPVGRKQLQFMVKGTFIVELMSFKQAYGLEK